MPAGYSGTPLPKKLGIKEGHSVALWDAPTDFSRTLGALPEGARLKTTREVAGYDVVLFFARDEEALDQSLRRVARDLLPESALWICWPKKTSSLFQNLTGDGVRSRGLATGLVDIKVCAVDEDWSGLKFVYRLEDRPKTKKK